MNNKYLGGKIVKVNKEYRLKYTERAQELVEQMSLEEKVYLMSGKVSMEELLESFEIATHKNHYNWYPYPAGGNERLGIPEMKFVDGPRGAVSGTSTAFPVAMARGATFDKGLEERVGSAIGKEIRAHGGNLFGGVCINLAPNPGWGRSQEVYGEDSHHLGAMGSSLVKGVQGENVIATIKHFAFNSMENARFKVNVEADKRTEREVYLPHFKDAVDAGAASVMSAYNLYKGEHAGHSDYLLNQVLKDEWGFDGIVISDFVWGLKDTIAGANGGMDIEMCHTKYFGDNLVEAVKNGQVDEEVVDEAAKRIIRTLLAFTEADDKEYDKNLISSEEHKKLALEVAEKSMTLMQNTNDVLPFLKEDSKRVAVIGDLGNKGNIGDHGSSRVYPEYIITPLEGVKNLLPDAEVVYSDGEDIEVAKDLASSADSVIFIVGYDHDDEGESISNDDGADLDQGGDRESLSLHTHEVELIKEVGPVNNNSVAVLIGGSTITVDEWQDKVSGILMAYYPGMEGGTAIAKTIFGDVNPSGKLPFVVPAKEEHLPQIDWDTEEITYGYYHGYAKLDKENIKPSRPYGFGMSYTTFSLTNANFKIEGNEIVATVDVKNIGERQGAEVVQMYVGFENSKVDRPVKVLRGFERIELDAGETKKVEIKCPVKKIQWFNPETDKWELENMEYEVYIGNSSDEKDLLKGSIIL